MSVLAGIMLHATGASCAALCYTPQKNTVQWSWQTFWLAQAAVCWLLLPIAGTLFTIPHAGEVLAEIPAALMLRTFLLGAVYGIGGTAFGIAIRYVGFSLTYAVSVGLSCVLGTLLPPLFSGQLSSVPDQAGASYIIMGMILGIAGIALCGVAGRSKEKYLQQQKGSTQFSLAKGLPLCLLAGVLSAVYGFAIAQAQPMADIAVKYGAGDMQNNIIYLFANTGAFASTALYCIYLHSRHRTWGQYRSVPDSRPGMYFFMALLTGILWYSQFFFYGLGHVRMGTYKFSSWAIHMIMLVLFSSLAGIIMKEWAGANARMRQLLSAAIAVLIVAVLVISYGNYLGE